MTDNITAEIVAIGTEILLGEITDTNSVYLAQQFRDAGINVFFMTSVGDNRQRISDAIRLALSRADIVITCGGLGPTVDDMTRHGVADATGRQLTFHQASFDSIVARFATYNVTMTENNRQQAFLPEGAIPVPNPVGTAPCFIVEQGSQCVISLPGVPRELKFQFEKAILPYLRRRYQLGIIKARILKTAGIGESSLDDLLGHDLLSASNPTVGLAAHHGIIDIRITAKAATAADADALLEQAAQQVYARAGTYIFGEGQADLGQTLIAALRQHGQRMAIVEAGIAGAISDKLNLPEAQEHLHVTQYDHPDALRAALNDAPDTLRQLAESAAEQARVMHHAAVGIAILSLPDVDESADDTQATAVAIAISGQPVKSRIYGFGALNTLTRDWVSRWAMSYSWQSLKEIPHVD